MSDGTGNRGQREAIDQHGLARLHIQYLESKEDRAATRVHRHTVFAAHEGGELRFQHGGIKLVSAHLAVAEQASGAH